MPNAEHLDVLSRGVAEWNAWREANPGITPDLTAANLEGEDLPNIDLHGADLSGANLANANLREAQLHQARGVRTEISGADLIGATIWEADFTRSDFGGSDLTAAILTGARIANSNMSGATLVAAELSNAVLSESRLRSINFTQARLDDTDLHGSELIGALFRNAQLVRTRVAGADFTRARLGWTALADLDLSDARGLREVLHLGPSTVGLDTLLRSKGAIPDEFLAGAGIPGTVREAFLGQARQTSAMAARSFFISARYGDEPFAERLRDRMARHGLRAWLVPETLRQSPSSQQEWHLSLLPTDRLLLIMNEQREPDDWSAEEWRLARETEQRLGPGTIVAVGPAKESGRPDPSPSQPAVAGIGGWEIHGFPRWTDPASFDAAFESLRQVLEAEVSGTDVGSPP